MGIFSGYTPYLYTVIQSNQSNELDDFNLIKKGIDISDTLVLYPD